MRPRFLHQTLLEYADISSRFCPWARVFFHLKRSQVKSRWKAPRALALRWIRVVMPRVVNNTPYNDEKYTGSLRKKTSEILAFLDVFTPQSCPSGL